MNAWLENERNSMRFLNHLLCRPLRDLWTEDPPELRARAGAARWRPVIRLALPLAYWGLCPALCKALQPALSMICFAVCNVMTQLMALLSALIVPKCHSCLCSHSADVAAYEALAALES